MLLRCCCSRGDRPSIRFIIDPLYIHPASPQQYHALPVAIGTHQHWTSWLARAKMKRGSFPRSAWRCHSNLVRRMELPFMVNTWKQGCLHLSFQVRVSTQAYRLLWPRSTKLWHEAFPHTIWYLSFEICQYFVNNNRTPTEAGCLANTVTRPLCSTQNKTEQPSRESSTYQGQYPKQFKRYAHLCQRITRANTNERKSYTNEYG